MLFAVLFAGVIVHTVCSDGSAHGCRRLAGLLLAGAAVDAETLMSLIAVVSVPKGGVTVCITVTLLDGLVLARSVYNTDMRFRSVVALGTAHLVVRTLARVCTQHFSHLPRRRA